MSGSSAKLAREAAVVVGLVRRGGSAPRPRRRTRAARPRATSGGTTARRRSSAAADEEQDRAVELDLLEDVRPPHLDRDHLARRRAAPRGAPAPPTRRRRAPARTRRRPPRAGRPSSASTVARTAAKENGGTRSRSRRRARRPAAAGSRSARVDAICPTLMKVAPSVVQSATSARPARARDRVAGRLPPRAHALAHEHDRRRRTGAQHLRRAHGDAPSHAPRHRRRPVHRGCGV